MGVPGYTPVLVKQLGFVFVKRIQDLDGHDLTGLQTWTHAGWKPIIGLDKKFSSNNKLYEVKTTNGSFVHVSPDTCYEVLHGFPLIDSSRYIKKSRQGLRGQLKAQDKFIQMHSGLVPGKLDCYENKRLTGETVFYNLVTPVGTYQAGIGNIIIDSS